MFKQPKPAPAAAPPPAPVAPDLTDATNRLNVVRSRRLATGGRNATYLSSIASASKAATAPASTLTGLQG